MNRYLQHIKISLIASLLFGVVLCGIYPLVIYGIGQLCFQEKAKGSLMFEGTRVVGSTLIGQNFSTARYFHPRPSAANYDATHSMGSNLGPTSQKLIDTLRRCSQSYREENGLGQELALPVDAVTTSASGLDPHISITNALLQIPRVAKARKLSEAQLLTFVEACTEKRLFGILGEPRVNVLLLNLKLDRSR